MQAKQKEALLRRHSYWVVKGYNYKLNEQLNPRMCESVG
jgi:hypothetical protein